MSASTGLLTISATGRQVLAVGQSGGGPDNTGSLSVAGTFTLTATIQGNPYSLAQDPSGIGWQNISSLRQDTLAIEATPTLTANTARTWTFMAGAFAQVGFNITAYTGTPYVQLCTSTIVGGNGVVDVASSSGSQNFTGAVQITSASADSFDVGPNGTTNPVLKVDSSTGSQADGLKVTGSAAGTGPALQAITSGTNTGLYIDAAAAGTVFIGSVASTALGLQVGSSTAAAGTKLIVQSTSTTALVVGRLGATTPAFQVDSNTATSITGVKIKSAATAGGVAISAIGEASNGNISFDAQGSGIVEIGGTSTGQVFFGKGSLKAPVFSGTVTALGTVQSSTPTAAQLIGGMLTQTGATGAGTITLPTGTALSAAFGRTPVAGDSFECLFANLGGSQTLTVTGATGTTVAGGATIATAKSAILVFTCTAANAWSIYTVGG